MSYPSSRTRREHGLGWLVWRFRRGLRLLVAAVVASQLLNHVVGPRDESLVWWVLLLFVVFHRPTREKLWAVVAHKRFRARFERALALSGVEPFASRPPAIEAVSASGLGHKVDLLLPLGQSADDLGKVAGHLAAAFRVREVIFERDPADGAHVAMTLSMRDPFAKAIEAWPLLRRREWRFDGAIPVGVDTEGARVECRLVEHHLLIGGEPGAGKSNALSLIVAAAALDPSVRLHLLDGKLVELAAWNACAEELVGPDMGEAIRLLEHLRAEMDRRYLELAALEKRKVDAASGLSFEVLVCDELALYLNHPDKKAAQRFAELLRDLLARGRAAGIVVVGATQKPSTDVVPSSLRDLFSYRWAMRCATRDASDTILGAGWATLGHSAAEIDAKSRGVGLLRHEGATPVKLRTYLLDDVALRHVASRAASLRGETRRSA